MQILDKEIGDSVNAFAILKFQDLSGMTLQEALNHLGSTQDMAIIMYLVYAVYTQDGDDVEFSEWAQANSFADIIAESANVVNILKNSLSPLQNSES